MVCSVSSLSVTVPCCTAIQVLPKKTPAASVSQGHIRQVQVCFGFMRGTEIQSCNGKTPQLSDNVFLDHNGVSKSPWLEPDISALKRL
jgi:hypothetical protein